MLWNIFCIFRLHFLYQLLVLALLCRFNPKITMNERAVMDFCHRGETSNLSFHRQYEMSSSDIHDAGLPKTICLCEYQSVWHFVKINQREIIQHTSGTLLLPFRTVDELASSLLMYWHKCTTNYWGKWMSVHCCDTGCLAPPASEAFRSNAWTIGSFKKIWLTLLFF